MSISIRKAFKNVASAKYNKVNIFYFFIILFLSGLCTLFVPDNLKSPAINFIIPILFYLIMVIISYGIQIVGCNNAIYNRPGVIPNLFEDILKILKFGVLNILGSTLVGIIIGIIISFPFFILIKIQPLLGLIVIPLACFLCVIYLAFYLNFVISLKFSDWFNYKKAKELINKSKNMFLIYISKGIILNILALIITFVIVMILSFVFAVQMSLTHTDELATKVTVSSLSSIVSAVIFGICGIYLIDLTSQYVHSINNSKGIIENKKKMN